MWETLLHPFAVAISWVWVWIHTALTAVGLGAGSGIAWVISIVLLTMVVRTLIVPLFLKQVKSSRGVQAMQPEIKKLQEKYKGKTDPASRQRMMEEQQALYKKYGTNPLASCFPILVQMPILFAMYRVIFAVKDIAEGTYTYHGEPAESLGAITKDIASEINSSTLFGVPLSLRITDNVGTVGLIGFIIMIIIMVAFQFLAMQLSLSKNMPPQSDPNNPLVRSQKMMLYMMPAMFILTGFFFQMGLLVYMVTSALWSYGQSLWTIMYMPTPGSPAHVSLIEKRQKAYQEWARPFFADYDAKRNAIDTANTADIEALNEATLTEAIAKAKKQHIPSDFPEAMGAGERVTILRNLASQDWDTLPDHQWMRAIHRATQTRLERQQQHAQREAQRRSGRGGRAVVNVQESDSETQAQTSADGLSPEELERRRQQRKAAEREARRKKRS